MEKFAESTHEHTNTHKRESEKLTQKQKRNNHEMVYTCNENQNELNAE